MFKNHCFSLNVWKPYWSTNLCHGSSSGSKHRWHIHFSGPDNKRVCNKSVLCYCGTTSQREWPLPLPTAPSAANLEADHCCEQRQADMIKTDPGALHSKAEGGGELIAGKSLSPEILQASEAYSQREMREHHSPFTFWGDSSEIKSGFSPICRVIQYSHASSPITYN